MAFPIAPNVNDVYVNGGVQYKWNGYAWDVVNTIGTASMFTYEHIATAGQTVFNVNYYAASKYLDVYLNGVRLANSEYTAVDGSTVVLAVGATVGDVFTAKVYDAVIMADIIKTVDVTTLASGASATVEYTDGALAFGIPSGPQGVQGLQGVQGVQGVKGDTGVGVPTGGTAGQVLSKVDATNYNTTWIDPPEGGGAVTPEILTGVETLAGYKRNGKDVYQKEIDFGALPNSTTKSVAISNYNASFAYWIDTSKSYAKRIDANYWVFSLDHIDTSPVGMVHTDIVNGNIRIITAMDYSNVGAIIVINYTK